MPRRPATPWIATFLLPVLLALVGCGGGGGGTNPPPPGGGDPLGQGTLTGEGGTLDFGPLEITAPPNGLKDAVRFEAETAALPAPLPAGVQLAGQPIEINVTAGAGAFEEPVTLTFHPENVTGGPGRLLAVAHYDEDLGEYEATTILGVDPNAGTVTVESRAFSTFVPIEAVVEFLPDEFTVPNFDPAKHGWSIPNFGSYFSPGGNCLGMAAYATWFYTVRKQDQLHNKYVGQVATILATRAHLAQSQKWANSQHQDLQKNFNEVLLGQYQRAFLFLFEKPLVQLNFNATSAHATVVYGYDATGFQIYDVNVPRVGTTLPWDATNGFGSFTGFDSFSFLAKPSLGRNQDFASLFLDAENGFHNNEVFIESPEDDETVNDRKVNIRGHVTDNRWDRVSVFAGGVRYDGVITGGNFDVEVPLSPGETIVTVVAGTALDKQSSFAPGSGVDSVNVKNELESSKLLVTLRWAQNLSDVDLYTTEPNGETAWYGSTSTTSGGKLDIDDTNGYGPEHYSLGSTVQDGLYVVRVHYFADHDSNEDAIQRISGTVDILLNEGEADQKLLSKPFALAVADSDADGPGGTGPSWAAIGTVDVKNGVITLN
ncbi:MAG TPA: hypothetical protein VEI97_20300 [bacterium]|nr:hypothetical protein [bacterium]